MSRPLTSNRLRRLIRQPAPASDGRGPAGHDTDTGERLPASAGFSPTAVLGTSATRAGQRCDLCAAPIADEHRHLIDLDVRGLRCACRACAVLFDRSGAGGGHYRLVPEERWRLTDLVLDDMAWDSLGVPVSMAFFFRDSAAGRVVAFYPSPGGAVEAVVDEAAWAALAEAHPALGRLVPDVEALLVRRVDQAREPWLVPVDDCYALVGLVRSNWTGISGGTAVWEEIDRFFTELEARARPRSARATR